MCAQRLAAREVVALRIDNLHARQQHKVSLGQLSSPQEQEAPAISGTINMEEWPSG